MDLTGTAPWPGQRWKKSRRTATPEGNGLCRSPAAVGAIVRRAGMSADNMQSGPRQRLQRVAGAGFLFGPQLAAILSVRILCGKFDPSARLGRATREDASMEISNITRQSVQFRSSGKRRFGFRRSSRVGRCGRCGQPEHRRPFDRRRGRGRAARNPGRILGDSAGALAAHSLNQSRVFALLGL